MLIGAAPKKTLTERVRGPCMRSSARPVSRSRKRSEAIGRQPHGNPPVRQVAAAQDDVAGVSERPASIAKSLFAACRVSGFTHQRSEVERYATSSNFQASSVLR